MNKLILIILRHLLEKEYKRTEKELLTASRNEEVSLNDDLIRETYYLSKLNTYGQKK